MCSKKLRVVLMVHTASMVGRIDGTRCGNVAAVAATFQQRNSFCFPIDRRERAMGTARRWMESRRDWCVGVRVFAASHPGVRAFSPSPGLPWDPPLRGSLSGGAPRRPPRCGRPVGWRIGWNRDAIGAWVYACSRPHTQGCGPSALPLGCLGIHRFAVLHAAGPREGRRVAAGRLVGGWAAESRFVAA